MRVPFTRKFSTNEKAEAINQEQEKEKAISQLCADFRPGVKLPVAASIVEAARWGPAAATPCLPAKLLLARRARRRLCSEETANETGELGEGRCKIEILRATLARLKTLPLPCLPEHPERWLPGLPLSASFLSR